MLKFFKKLFSGSDNIELKNIITNGAFLVDVRSQGEYLSGHVKGSANIPLDQIKNQLAKFKGKNNMTNEEAEGIISKLKEGKQFSTRFQEESWVS